MTSQASDELFAPLGTDAALCYQTFGDPDAAPLLLVMGLGGPLIWWPTALCEMLADQGFFVIRYDNRDVGHSWKLNDPVSRTQLLRAFVGAKVPTPYSLADLADDAFALLDHLGIESAHVTGASMGGMIAQTMAIKQPQRVRSLVSMMSTTGNRRFGWQHPKLLPRLLLGSAKDIDGYITGNVLMNSLIGSPAFPPTREELESRARSTWERGLNPPGVARQMLAVLTQPDRCKDLASLTMPVCVLHGRADAMVHVSGGRATAAAVPHAELVLIDGMGHDLPAALFETFVRTIKRTATRVGPSRLLVTESA